MVIEAILFDFDNTLVKTLPLHCLAYQMVFEKNGMTLAKEEYYNNIGGKASEIIPKFIGNKKCNISVEELHRQKKDLSLDLLNTMETEVLFPGKLLPIFRGKYKIGLCSAGSKVFINAMLKKLNWEHYFDVVLTAEDVKHGKPNPEVFLLAAKKLSVKPENCFVFEDQIDGINAAKAAGMDFFLV